MGVVGGDRRRGSRSRSSQDGPFPLHYFPGLSGPHQRKQQSPQHILFPPLFFPAPLRVLPLHPQHIQLGSKCILEAAISPTNGSPGGPRTVPLLRSPYPGSACSVPLPRIPDRQSLQRGSVLVPWGGLQVSRPQSASRCSGLYLHLASPGPQTQGHGSHPFMSIPGHQCQPFVFSEGSGTLLAVGILRRDSFFRDFMVPCPAPPFLPPGTWHVTRPAPHTPLTPARPPARLQPSRP